ncbi:MAG: SAM-dependent methyltransferase [Spirochaetes bacterium]|nr:SAM-dependent methyltransferase [Spirochaetota bacterium]
MPQRVFGSFRDPAGFVFEYDGQIYRQINHAGKNDFEKFTASGLFERLTKSGDLIAHREVDIPPAEPALIWKTIQPERIGFISYPYEWCFSQLKDAALLTLRLQKKALAHGMTLKDASAYNVQFHRGKPVFIDTLSFAAYQEGVPWVAYGQFCRHFLAPLLLMHYCDVRLAELLPRYLDGIPLDLVSALLPRSTYLRFSVLSHIHLHAKAQKTAAQSAASVKKYSVSKHAQTALLENLENLIRALRWNPQGTEWADYTDFNNYNEESLTHKKELVADFLTATNPASVWDAGANTGVFSRLASARGIATIASDIDAAAVEKNYQRCVAEGETQLLPLLTDLANPAPALGWQNRERAAFSDRLRVDMGFALALIHHLAITHHLPFRQIAGFFANICRALVIEFVPRGDSQLTRMLSTRVDIFTEYTQENFEAAFAEFFTVQQIVPVRGSSRTMYLMVRR